MACSMPIIGYPADYELMVRFLARHKARYAYLPEVIVKMRVGGASTRGLRSTWILNREILRACAENDISLYSAPLKVRFFELFADYSRHSTSSR